MGQGAALQGVGTDAPVEQPNFGGTPVFRLAGTSNVRPSFKSGWARSAATSASPELWRGLQGAWCPAMGNTGATLRDLSGRGNHGTLLNMDPGTDWVMSPDGPALDMDGTNDSVSLNSAVTDIITTAAAFSITQRVYITDTTADSTMFGAWSGNYILWRDEYAPGDRYGLAVLSVDDINYVTWTAAGTAIANQWQTVTAVYNIPENTVTFYIDGQLQTGLAGSGLALPKKSTTQATAIGADKVGSTSRTLTGQISNTYLHTRAISQREAMTLHRDPLAPFRLRSFVPHNTLPTYDQFCVKQSEYYLPGATADQLYSPGTTAEEIYTPGAAESQIGC